MKYLIDVANVDAGERDVVQRRQCRRYRRYRRWRDVLERHDVHVVGRPNDGRCYDNEPEDSPNGIWNKKVPPACRNIKSFPE